MGCFVLQWSFRKSDSELWTLKNSDSTRSQRNRIFKFKLRIHCLRKASWVYRNQRRHWVKQKNGEKLVGLSLGMFIKRIITWIFRRPPSRTRRQCALHCGRAQSNECFSPLKDLMLCFFPVRFVMPTWNVITLENYRPIPTIIVSAIFHKGQNNAKTIKEIRHVLKHYRYNINSKLLT
jgi:hypothetical protein